MRLDKYLKVTRILKRRAVAKELADNGRILLNDKTAKASAPVKLGDIIEVTFGSKKLKIRVLEIQEFTKKEKAVMMYEVIE